MLSSKMLFVRVFLLLVISFIALGANNNVVYKANIAKLVDKETAFDVADIKSMVIKISIDKDLAKHLEKKKDVRSKQKLADSAQKSVKQTVKTVGKLFDEYEKRAKTFLDKNQEGKAKQVFKDFEVQANKLIDKIEKRALKDMSKEWGKIQKSKKEYKKYKLKAGIKLVAKIGGLVGNVARAVGSGGVDLSAIKSIVTKLYGIYKDIDKLAASAEKIQDRNEKTLAKLQKSLLKKDPASLKEKAKEKAKKAIVKLMTGGVKSLRKSNDLFENKLRGLDVRADDISKKIASLLEKMDEKKADLTDKQIKSIEKLTALHLSKIDILNDRIKKGLENFDEMVISIKELEAITPAGRFAKITALYDKYSKQLSLLVTVVGKVDNVAGMLSPEYKAMSAAAKNTIKTLK